MEPSELAKLEMERRKRRKQREKAFAIEPSASKISRKREIKPEPLYPDVKDAVSLINSNIKPLLKFDLEELERQALSFASFADSREINNMNETLIQFEVILNDIQRYIENTKKIIFETYQKTGSALDAQKIISNTYSIDKVKRDVIQTLQLLEGAAETTIDKIRFDNPQSIRTKQHLERIQKFGEEHFEGYQPRKIEIEMDVSRDEQLARKLASETMQEFRPRYARVDEPSISRIPERISKGLPLLPLTSEEARKIAIDNPEMDILTLKEVLKTKGFPSEIIQQTINEFRNSEEQIYRRPSPISRSFYGEEPIEKVHLDIFKMKDLISIAKKYGLNDYKRKRKPGLILYLQNNLEPNILKDEIRAHYFSYKIDDLPIIKSTKF